MKTNRNKIIVGVVLLALVGVGGWYWFSINEKATKISDKFLDRNSKPHEDESSDEITVPHENSNSDKLDSIESKKNEKIQFLEIKKENIVEIIEGKLMKNSEPSATEIVIFDKNRQKTGVINLLEENTFLQTKNGKISNDSSHENYQDYKIIVSLDQSIVYRDSKNSPVNENLSVSFTAISPDENQINSVLKAFNSKGELIFDSGIIANKYFINPFVSHNKNYLAVYSSIYEDSAENFSLTSENKMIFFNIKTKKELEINNQKISLDIPRGYFDAKSRYIHNSSTSIIIDFENKIFYQGKREPGTSLKIDENNQIYFQKTIDPTSIVNVTDKFKIYSIN